MTVFRESRNILFPVSSGKQAGILVFSPLNVCDNGLDAGRGFPKAPAKFRKYSKSSKEFDIMNQINLQNRLAVSNGTVKNVSNNAMQPASQTTESPETAKKRLGLLAVLAVGVDAAASFLKSKMEKAAAVASQVGAAISESKKTISAAAVAILVVLRPEPSKKARFASIPILALLAGIFASQPQAMAQVHPVNEFITANYLAKYTSHHHRQFTTALTTIPRFGVVERPSADRVLGLWEHRGSFQSYYNPPTYWIVGHAAEVSSRIQRTTTIWRAITNPLPPHNQIPARSLTIKWRMPPKGATWSTIVSFEDIHLSLRYHRRVGEKTTQSGTTTRYKDRVIWENKVHVNPSNTSTATPAIEFRLVFTVLPDDFSLTNPDVGSCVRTFYAPGSPFEFTPCVPRGMKNHLNNGYLTYLHQFDQVRPSSQ